MDKKTIVALALLAVLSGSILLVWKLWIVDDWAERRATAVHSVSGRKGKLVRDYSAPGQFGDSFAPISALFSAVAMIATVLALHESAKINRAQMKALADQDRSIATQSAAIAKAIEHLGGQASATRELAKHQKQANQLSRRQMEAQDVANVIAMMRAQAHLIELTDDLDRQGTTAVGERLRELGERAFGVLPGNSAHDIWTLLVHAVRTGHLHHDAWHNVAMSEEVRRVLRNRELLEVTLDRLKEHMRSEGGAPSSETEDGSTSGG